MTYEEFKQSRKTDKYKNQKCYIPGCNNLAEYEVGDSRFYCGMCEEHANIKEEFNRLNKKNKITIKKFPYNMNKNNTKFNF